MRLKSTHNPPSAKTHNNPTFCLIGRLSVDRSGIGNTKITASVNILSVALKKPKNNIFTHRCRSSVSPFRDAEAGVHLNMVVSTISAPYMTVKAMVIQHAKRIRGVLKTRRY